MAQPPAYNRTKDFGADYGDQTDNQAINNELDAASRSINDIRENLAKIQRDDGGLVNGIVTEDSLDPALKDALYDEFSGNVNDAVLQAQQAAVEANNAAIASEDARDEARQIAESFGDLEAARTEWEAAVQSSETAASAAGVARDAALASAQLATTEANRAEAAAGAASLNAGVYATTAAGLAATVNNQYFSVPATNANEYLILYRNVSGAAVEQKRYPSVRGMETMTSLATICPWLDKSAMVSDGTAGTNWFLASQQRVEAALAIKSVRIENGAPNEKYVVGVFCNSDPVQLDRVSIFALSTLTVVATTGAVAITKNANGLTRVVVGDTANAASIRAILEVDYREITTIGTLVSGSGGPLRIARANIFTTLQQYHDNEALPAWIAQASRSAVLYGHDRWREAAFAIRGIQLNDYNAGETYRVTVLTKDDPTFLTRISVSDSTGGVCSGAVTTPTGVGLMRIAMAELNASGITGVAHVNFGNIQGPFVISDSASNLVIDPTVPDIFEEAVVSPKRLDSLEWPAWLSKLSTPTPPLLRLAKNIMAIDLKGTDPAAQYGISVITKQDPTFGDRIFIRSGSATVARWLPGGVYTPSPDGVDRLPLDEFGNSGVSGEVIVNWGALPTGNLLTTPTPTLIVDPAVLSARGAKTAVDALANELALISSGGGAMRPLCRAIRVALAGSSITWGQGYLGELSYVGGVELFLRTRVATSLHASNLAPDGTVIARSNLWLGEARRISGAGAEVTFDMWGDELTINLCRERGNAGAALVDVYADDQLFGTFSTFNDEPQGVDTANFTGNSVDLRFDLGRAFTHNHAVTVSGTPMVGGMNTQGSGATIPTGWDYMVVRSYNAALNRVTHVLWFKVAPTGPIVCTYDYGESICYMRGTLGNTGTGLDSPLESPFGDGSVSEDPTQPASISSGLGFRESDVRACQTYALGDAKQRRFRLVVRDLDPRATGGTPWLDLNFVTNRMHHIMNAGIGGWSGELFLTSDILLNRIDRVAEFRPDVFMLESSTNDDWLTHVTKGWVTRTGVTAQQLKDDESSNYFSSITGTSPNKTVLDDRIPISAAAAKSVTLNTSGATISAAPGDALVIGSFHGDHRRVAVRLIDTYAAGVATFKRPISADDFAQADSLASLVGDWAMIKAAPTWVSQVEQCVQIVQDENPDCRVHITTCGAPNYHHRRLFGYRELGMDLARTKGWGFVDFYDATNRFQYNQPQTGRLYITTSQGTTSTGAASYPLYMPNGSVPTARMIHMPRVLVDGVDRTNKGVHIEGGYAYSWASGVAEPSLSNDTLQQKPYRLVFTSSVPAAGAVIEVSYATRIWSTDDTHPGRLDFGAYGIPVFGNIGQQIVDAQTIGVLQ